MVVEIKYSKDYLTYWLHHTCLIEFSANLVEAKTASTNLTWLYLCLHISRQILCTLLICYVLDGLLHQICFRMFYSKHSIAFENTYRLRAYRNYWTLDAGLWTLDDVLWTIKARLSMCRLLTAKSWSTRGASHQPAFMGNCLSISHSGLWALDALLWTLDSGRWTLDARLWMLDSGNWALDPGRWTLNPG